MNIRYCYLTIFFIIYLFVPGGFSIELKYDFTNNNTIFYTSVINGTTSQKVFGLTQNNLTYISSNIKMSFDKINDANLFLLNLKFYNIVNKINNDTNDIPQTSYTINEKINCYGKVIHDTSHKNKSVVDNWLMDITLLFPQFPKKNISVGDTWNVSFSKINNKKTIKSDIEYKFAKKTKKYYIIEYTGKYNINLELNEDNSIIVSKGSADAKGKILFNRTYAILDKVETYIDYKNENGYIEDNIYEITNITHSKWSQLLIIN